MKVGETVFLLFQALNFFKSQQKTFSFNITLTIIFKIKFKTYPLFISMYLTDHKFFR